MTFRYFDIFILPFLSLWIAAGLQSHPVPPVSIMTSLSITASDSSSYLHVKDAAAEAELEAEGGEAFDLFPSDSYVGERYWADLPYRERIRWVFMQQVRGDVSERSAFVDLWCV